MDSPTQSVVRHDIGINNSDGSGVTCDCGYVCADLDGWHTHTVNTYNNPSESAIWLRGRSVHSNVVTVEPGQAAIISACTKVACAAAGNNIECWTLTMDDYPVLFGLFSRQIAEDLAVHGGVISATYTLSTC